MDLQQNSLFNPVDRNGKIHIPSDLVFKVMYLTPDGIIAIPYDATAAQVEEWPKFRYKDCSPIPINRTQFARLGFTNVDGDAGRDKDGNINIFHIDKMNRWRVEYDLFERAAVVTTGYIPELGYSYKLPPRIEYVHELQIIILDLFGIDLTYKPEQL